MLKAAGLAKGKGVSVCYRTEEALAFVLEHATTHELQERCVRALITKTEILWHLLDCVEASGKKP